MVSKNLNVGVLALQGAFARHLSMVKSLGVRAAPVRFAHELQSCDALIIPGGESTTMLCQIEACGLREPLLSFASVKPLFGTCAGLILMSKEDVGRTIKPLGILDMTVERNAYGRQLESFKADLKVSLKPRHKTFSCQFIRAPVITRLCPSITVLAAYRDQPVLVQQGMHLGSSFHPELTQDPSIHQYFINCIS